MKRETLLLFVLFLVYSCQTKEEKLKESITQITTNAGFNGIIHLSHNNEILFQQAIHNRTTSLPVLDEHTPIYLASLTKLFTTLSILRLAENGKIDLDASISNYRKNFRPSFGQQITIRQLLNMTSGLPRELDETNSLKGVLYDKDGFAGPFLDTMPDFSLAFEPGSQQTYSNLNFWLLGSVIEAVTQQNLNDAFSYLLFTPLNMTNSGLFNPSQTPILGYISKENQWIKDTTNYTKRYASGGCYASIADLILLADAIKSKILFSEKLQAELYHSSTSVVEVYGSLPGFTNLFICDLESDYTLIVLNNVGITDLKQMTLLKNEICQILDIDLPTSPKSKKVALRPITTLSDSIPLEASMKQWVRAIEAQDKEAIFQILEKNAPTGEMKRTDPTWEEIITVSKMLPNFRVAGYRWLETEAPAGLEVWFECDGEAKLAFLWITDEGNTNKISALMVKPDDMEWLGRQY